MLSRSLCRTLAACIVVCFISAVECEQVFSSTDAGSLKVKIQDVSAQPAYLTAVSLVGHGSGIVDFSIPTGTRRITMMLYQVSTTSTNPLYVRLGDGSGVKDTGYNGAGARSASTAIGTQTSTAGAILRTENASARACGIVHITNVDGNIWTISGTVGDDVGAYTAWSGSGITLGTELTTVRLYSVDNFDYGVVNVTYE